MIINPTKKAIINVSNDKYRKGQDRLEQSLQGNTDADILMFKSEQEVGALPHSESMYGFKPMAFQKAYDIGYRKILWLDASMYVIKNLEPIFDEIDKKGYFFQDSGWFNRQWTNQETIYYFGTDKGKMISSGVLGLDMNTEQGYKFYEQWVTAMKKGLFNGSHDNHRHDQSSASLIIEKMGLEISENNYLWQYGQITEEPIHENILIIANGII